MASDNEMGAWDARPLEPPAAFADAMRAGLERIARETERGARADAIQLPECVSSALRRRADTCATLAPGGWVCEEHGRSGAVGCMGPWRPAEASDG